MEFKNTLTYLFTCCITLLFFGGCKKDDDSPVAPVITFQSISVINVEQFNNNPIIKFAYEDFQGDLGEIDPDNYSLRVKDSRLSDYDWYHIPPMTPDLKELHIKGVYSLELPALFLLGSGTQESTSLTIQIRDRAGNWSNIISTPNVLVVDSL